MLDSSILIAAERRQLKPGESILTPRCVLGEIPIVLSAFTIAEIRRGIYGAKSEHSRIERREFPNELKAMVPIQAITAATAEIVPRIGGEQAARGVNLADLIIGASALVGHAVATSNLRDFSRIPGPHVLQL